MANRFHESVTLYERITGENDAIIIGKDFVAVNYQGPYHTDIGVINTYDSPRIIIISGRTRTYFTRQGRLLPQLIYFRYQENPTKVPIIRFPFGSEPSQGLSSTYTSLLTGITLDDFVSLLKNKGMHFPEELQLEEDAPTSP